MKTLQATTARILLLCLIFIEQNVAEPTARHNVAHHQDTARRHHAPSGIQAPHKLAPSSSKVYCISADSNIYEILHKANAYCRGNDFKCTFYHYSDHKYQNLGTIYVNRELFDKLLAKYENWLMTSEPIDENNGKDSNHKVRLKGSGNKLYSTYIIDEKTPDKANKNIYDHNVMQDASKLDKHYRRHKAKLTGDQKTRYINGERVSVDPKFNKQQKYYEVFLPKDKHRGDPRTIYVDIDGDKENADKELNELNDKPIKVQLNEYSSNEEGKFSVHDKHNRNDVYRHHSNKKIARTEDIEETNKYQSQVAGIKLGDNDKMLSDFNDTDDENTEDEDDKLHRIHLVETNKHHNDLSADNFTYKRTNTVQLNEPVFHVENPRNRNNMHIFSLPDYTGHHSDIISDYTGYKDIHLLPNLPDDEEVPSLPSIFDISLSEATEKESPITLYTNPDLQRTNDNLLPGHINYFAPKVTHGTPFSSQSGSSPIVSSSSETAAIPKYSPFDISLRSSPYSLGPETLTPCDLKTLSQGTISSSPSTVLSNEDKYKISLLSSPFEATKSFENSNLFKTLPSAIPETTYFSQPLDVTMPVDATSFLNNFPKSFESVASYPPTATMPSPLNSKLGPEICQFPQTHYSQFSPPNLGLLNQLQQNNNFAKPMFSQNNMFSQPSRDIFDIKINPFMTRPPFSYSYAEPNPIASYLSSPGSVINSSPSAYTNSILNGNRIPGTVSNSFLPLSPANQMSPLNLRQQMPNYYSPPCPKPVSTSPYNNISPFNVENYQIADNLALNANVEVQDFLSPIQNTPLSVSDHPYRTTPSNYIRPTEANIFSSSAPNQAEPMTFNALENQFIQSQGETSSYSELAHITEKPCLKLQNEPLVTFDASLLGGNLLELSPTKPVVDNTDVNISDSSFGSELNKLTPVDFSIVDSDSDTIHIQLNTTINLNQESQSQPEYELNLNQNSNSILDSSLTDQDVDISPCTAVNNNKPSLNVITTINLESEQTQNNEAVITEFDSSLIGTGLPIPSDDSIVTKVDTENLTGDSSSTDFIPLEQSDKNVERELNQTVNIKQESKQTDIEYSVIDEPITILPSDSTEQEFKVDIGITGPQPLDSTLIDLESDNITETVAQKFETVDGLPNVNVTVCEPDINLSVQTNIDLKPEAENPQLLESPTGTTIDITINTSVNITDNNVDVLEPELVETKPNEKSIITNEETEFIPLDEAIHTKDKETINEFEAGEFIPAFTSGMNIPAEDITAEILPNNELNSSLVGPNLNELIEKPEIAATEVNITADLIGPTIFDTNETLNDMPSKVEKLDSSLIKPISGKPTIPPCIEPLEVLGQSDIENLTHSGAIKESDILLSSDPLTFENSLIGPSLINDMNILETPPPEKLKEILLTSESPINFESNLLGPSLLPHKDSIVNIESSLVGPGLDQILNAPKEISNSDVELNFKSNLLGPNLIIDANEPDLLRKLEAGTKIDDGKPGPTIVDGKPLVEDSVPYSEYQLDASLIGPHLNENNNIIAETNEVKPKFEQTNSVILDSSLIDNLFDSEKSNNGPSGPSIVSSANILSSDLKREGLPQETDISLICPNPPFESKYEELPSPPFVPKISFSHDLIGPTLSKLHPETSLPNPYIPHEGTPIVSNGFLEELKPTTYSKLPDLYLPATPFKNAPQHSLPCDNFFTPSPLPSSLLNSHSPCPASVLNLPSNMLSQYQSPLYANTIPFSPLSPTSKYSPLHNLPHTPFSSPYLKPEYLQSVRNPLVLNALLNNPHLKDALSYYSPLQSSEPFEQIGFPRQPNLQNLPNKYLQALNGIPFNMQPFKSTIPCLSQTKTPLSSTEINWQELESLPVEVQNTPALKPVKNEAPISNIYSPLQIKESESLFDLNHQNYHMIESELNKFIQEAKHHNKLEKYEIFEELSVPPCEKVKNLPGNNVEKYISDATAFVEPFKGAKEQVNLKKTEFIKLEPELHYPMDDTMYLPRNPPPKYKPKVEEQVCYQPLNKADVLEDYQLLESPVNTPIVKPSVSQKKIPKLPSTDQFYPYEMLPEPLALPAKPSSSPASNAKAQIAPYLPDPCLQEYTSVPASEYLLTSNLRPMPTPVSSRPSKTYAGLYIPEYSSPSYIDTYSTPIEAPKTAAPCKPSETYASPYLPTYSNTPLFETGIPIESTNLPISALSKELPILPAPLKPLSSTPLTSTEFMSPSYYSPTSTTYTDYSFINQANILPEPSSLSSATSGLPCLRPLPESNPIFRGLMANPQLMKAMNLPMANNIFPWNNVNRKPNPFMLQTPNYLSYEPQTPNYLPYESMPLNMENLKKNQLYKSAIESNLQKLKTEEAPKEVWTTYDETNSYANSNDGGTKINENIVPENHLETVPCTLDSEEYTNVAVNKDLTTIPLQTLSYGTELLKPKPAIQSSPIKLDSSKQNELSTPILELNSQKLDTAPSEALTNYNENSNYIYTNDSGTKIHEDIVLESHLEAVPNTLKSKENIKVHEAPISNYAIESKLNHGRPVSYSQVKEAEYYQPIEKVPQASDMQWLPLSSAEYSPNSSPGLFKPCSKSSPFIPLLNQSPYLLALSHFPSFLPTNLKGSPYNNKLDSLPYSSSPYYPATVEEYSELPTTVPFRNYFPSPIKSNVLENFVPLEGVPYSPSAVSSPYTRLPSPASYLPSQYQSNMTPIGLQLSPLTTEQLRYESPITEGPSPIEYTPVQSPINPLPSKSMKPIPCPYNSELPIQNVLPSHEASVSYESYSPQPGLKYQSEYQNIIEHLPTPVPLKESPVYYEPASSPRLIKSPNIIESLPFTISPSSENIVRPSSSINYESYTSPLEEYVEVSPSLPCRPLMKPISPLPKPQTQLSVDEYTILPSSFEATPFETYSSYQTEPYSQDISKPSPKSKPDLAKCLPVDTSPYQIVDQPYTPINKVQTPSNFEYISETSPLLKQLLAPPFKGYNSLPCSSNVKLPYLPPTYMPLDMINTLPPALMNPFIKSELREILAPLSVQTNEITSTPKESNTVSDISSLDNYEEYIEPCPSPKPLQSSSLIKPLMAPIKASPELFKEIPIEFENVFSSSDNIPQYISPNNSLLKQLIGNAYNSPLFVLQNNKQKPVPSEIDDAKLSTYEPIICNIDETSSPNAPIVSELPDIKPCDLKAPLLDQYQFLPTEKISPITMTPLSSTKSPLLSSSYQEICPVELAETLPMSSVRPPSSSVFNPAHRPSKLTPIPMQYVPKSIIEYLPDVNNICPNEILSYMEPAMVEAMPYAPKSKNIKQIQLDGFPIAELFAKAPKILPYNPLTKIELPKTSEYQNIPKDSSDWVLINNESMADEINAKLTPCEYTQTTENPAEAEYLKLAKLLETKSPKTEFEKYSKLIEENQYEEIPTNLQDDNVCKNVYKPENIGIHLPQKPQNSATFDNFYANNHIGASPLICLIDPRRESKPIKSLIDAKLPYNEINPDITYLDEKPSRNIDLATDTDYNFITPSENLRSIPVPISPIEVSPISIDSKYLDKPTFKSPKMIYGPNPVEYLPENQYYYPPKDNIDDIKYSGYKTYQLPTQKLTEKSSYIPLETYYPTVPISPPKSSIPYSYMPTISPETYRPEYETLESPAQAKSDLKVQPQSPIYNNYYPTKEVTVKPDNLDKNDEIKNCIINYINSKGLKDKLYTNNEELTIPIGDIAITKKEPHTAKIVPTSNPSIGLKVWQSNVKLVKAELKFKTNEVSVKNFMPILNNLNEYDIQEIRKIIKKYIDDKYGNHIEVNEPYTIDNQYTVVKDLNRNENEKYNLLWPTYYV